MSWPDGLIGLDEQGVIVELSPAARSILGWGLEELQKHSPHEILCAQNRSHQHSPDNCPLAEILGPQELVSALWKGKDGHYISVDLRSINVEYKDAVRVISFIDNQHRLHSQVELEKFAEYVENSPAPIAEFDSSGQLLFGNAALQKHLLAYGFNDEGIGHIFPHNICDICESLEADTFKSKASVSTKQKECIATAQLEDKCYSWHFHRFNGTTSNHNNVTTLYLTTGSASRQDTRILGYAFDITKQKQAELLAEEQRAQVRKEFYAKMVHELRTPLNAIIGLSDILLVNPSPDLQQKSLDTINAIKKAGIHLNDLVTATLDISKIESGKMSLDISQFSIADVCEDINGQMTTLAEKKGLVYRFTNLASIAIFSDKSKVRQIVTNLVSNAIKYTLKGSVHLIVSEQSDAVIGRSLCILVTDTGIGIPKGQRAKLFNNFEQIDDEQNREEEGTGLGLALVKDMVTLLGGQIYVESTYGAGSSFQILLPFSSK